MGHLPDAGRGRPANTVGMSTPAEDFQITADAAEVYEAQFVPGIFAERVPHTLDAAGVRAGQSVLDVACGTGVVARAAVDRVGPTGSVTGVDLNEAMLAVARRLAPGIEWHQGDAAALPFEDDRFDAVVCQMALMFFPDPVAALSEMARVARPGATVAAVVPASLASSPGYSSFAEVVARHAGRDAVGLVTSYFALGDLDGLRAMFTEAGLTELESSTRTGHARFGSIDDYVATEVEGSPLVERIDDDTYRAIRVDCVRELSEYVVGDDGAVAVPFDCHAVAGRVGA
jgi:ubiquinone/menaquinone biosynthesis C-methylase UbiE